MGRRGRWGLGLLAVGALGVLGVRSWAIDQVDAALLAQGFSWEARRTAPLAAHWEELTGPLGTAEQLSIRGTWPLSVRVRGPEVDLSKWMDEASSDPADAASGPGVPTEIVVENLTVRWGQQVLMKGLSGPLRPVPDLSGPEGTLRLERGPDGERIAVATTTVPLDLAEIKGTAALQIRASETIEAKIDMQDAVLFHPLIASDPLPPQALSIQLRWSRSDQALSMDGTLGAVEFSVEGTAELAPLQTSLRVTIADTALSDVVDIFGDGAPESDSARLAGTLGLSAQVTGPPWQIDPTPTAQGLSVSGALPQGFLSHMVQWQATSASGMPLIKQTGPAHPDWTPLSEAGWVPLAVVAAEDGSFETHPGFDMRAIREAISQARAGERLRGGSTLTQQLAKNLFLSSERTLVRKLRELLLALNLEHTLSKPAILALYLNVVEFGPGIHGIGAATDAYFLKSPSSLTLTEAAWLASILPGPRSAHARARMGKTRRARLRTILDRMTARGTITAAQAERAKAAPLRFVVE